MERQTIVAKSPFSQYIFDILMKANTQGSPMDPKPFALVLLKINSSGVSQPWVKRILCLASLIVLPYTEGAEYSHFFSYNTPTLLY